MQMEIKDTIAQWVRKARKSANLSGEELGARMALELRTERGHSKGNISHWELGKHQPSIQQLLAISKITTIALPTEILSALTLPSQGAHSERSHLSPAAQKLIEEIIAAEEHGTSSPQLIEALTKVLHVALPATASNHDYASLRDAARDPQ